MGQENASASANKWKDKWIENYEGRGDCKDLDKRLKQIKKSDGTLIAEYLPWAVVERIFRFQDGETETLKGSDEETIVERDSIHTKDEVDPDSGAVTPKYVNSYFVNVKAKWMDQERTERYPLLDTKNNPMNYWTQADLNRAVQRAKVKAIAMVSGIGYKLFEDGDLQFGDDKIETEETKKQKAKTAEDFKKKTEEKKAEKAKKAKKETKDEKPEKSAKEEPKQSVMDIKDDTPKEPPKQEKQVIDVDDDEDDTEPVQVPKKREDVEDGIKRQFLSGGPEKSKIIKGFLKEKETPKVQDLSDEEVRELYRKAHQ